MSKANAFLPKVTANIANIGSSTSSSTDDLNDAKAVVNSEAISMTNDPKCDNQSNIHHIRSSENTGQPELSLSKKANSTESRLSTNGTTLKPPAAKQSTKNVRIPKNEGIFGIYISEFDPETSCEQIEQHIIERTPRTSSDLFITEAPHRSKRRHNNQDLHFIQRNNIETCHL